MLRDWAQIVLWNEQTDSKFLTLVGNCDTIFSYGDRVSRKGLMWKVLSMEPKQKLVNISSQFVFDPGDLWEESQSGAGKGRPYM